MFSAQIQDVSQIRDFEVVEEFQQMFRLIRQKMMIPLYLTFWLVDVVYAPHLKWEFLTVRIFCLAIAEFCSRNGLQSNSYAQIRLYALATSAILASGINFMIFRIPENLNLYFVGLILILIGSGSFLPFRKRDFLINTTIIFAPFYLITFAKFDNHRPSAQELATLLTQTSFIIGAIAVCFLVRYFHEALRQKEVSTRRQLQIELANREEIIRKKTEEGVILSNLARQFSPQVIESISTKKINLDQSQTENEISVVFIDIVNSTAKALSIQKPDFDYCINLFLEILIPIFLKYDLTIDKFLGDGLLAIGNSPKQRTDHALRAVLAANESLQGLTLRSEEFKVRWGESLQVRAGLALGKASVGFFGSQNSYRTFTAIGPVVNLASRLCSQGEPNTLLIDGAMYDSLTKSPGPIKLSFKQRTNRSIKGFEDGSIKVFEVQTHSDLQTQRQLAFLRFNTCHRCGGGASIELDSQQEYRSLCHSCCEILS